MKKLVVAAILATVVLVSTASAAAALSGAKAAIGDRDLTLVDMLTYALQDERSARAEYEVILEKLGVSRPFSTIIKAEEAHIGHLVDLFVTHGLAVPPDDTADLSAPKDQASAFEAGRQAEIDNIAMYDKFLAQDLPADVRRVFVQLNAASHQHLRAFTNNIARR